MEELGTLSPPDRRERHLLTTNPGGSGIPQGIEVKCYRGNWGLPGSDPNHPHGLSHILTEKRTPHCGFVDHTPGLDVELAAELTDVAQPHAGSARRWRPWIMLTSLLALLLCVACFASCGL